MNFFKGKEYEKILKAEIRLINFVLIEKLFEGWMCDWKTEYMHICSQKKNFEISQNLGDPGRALLQKIAWKKLTNAHYIFCRCYIRAYFYQI